jgi:Universal stress protein family
MKTQFFNRTEAGQILAENLGSYANRKDVLVLALPRGGVPVEAEVAKKLNATLDVFVARKLGLPDQPELPWAPSPWVACAWLIETSSTRCKSLIVVATHGFTGWKHFAIGSTAARVARAAPYPVLVVREKEHDFL